MATERQLKRVLLLLLLLLAAFAGLGYRLLDIQVLRNERYAQEWRINTARRVFREARRGDILDARGELLATSTPVKTVCADPSLIGGRQAEVARLLAPILKLPEADLARRLQPVLRTNDAGRVFTNRYVVLQRKVLPETWLEAHRALTNLYAGINEKKLSPSARKLLTNLRYHAVFSDVIEDQLRLYPHQNLASHVLGFTGMRESFVNGTNTKAILETAGADGIELAMNDKLTGVRGWRVIEVDSKKREMLTFRDEDVDPRDGYSVVLTIDSRVQQVLEEALAAAMRKHAPQSACGVVVRPATGELLALANLPDFDPNRPGDVPFLDARRNRVLTDIAEPGSTFKIVVVSGALHDGLVTLNDQFDCENGAFSFAGRVLHDHHRYDVLSVKSIITKSSNIGAAKIGIRLGQNRLYEFIRGYGFGTVTGLPLLGEVNGIVHPVKEWTKVSIAQIPMGQGLAVTRLQMAMAMSAIANNGVLMRPMLIHRLVDRSGRIVARYEPQPVRQVISTNAARLMVEALKTVVSAEGTAASAALEHYSVAGKTGTAQKAEHGHYVSGKFVSSFVGFFPADKPEVCIAITLDEPKNGHYGGEVAGPVFKEVGERIANYLNVKPDRIEDDFSPGLPGTNETRTLKTAAARTP